MQYPRLQEGLSFPHSHKLPPTISDFGEQPKRKREKMINKSFSGKYLRKKQRRECLTLHRYTLESRKFYNGLTTSEFPMKGMNKKVKKLEKKGYCVYLESKGVRIILSSIGMELSLVPFPSGLALIFNKRKFSPSCSSSNRSRKGLSFGPSKVTQTCGSLNVFSSIQLPFSSTGK